MLSRGGAILEVGPAPALIAAAPGAPVHDLGEAIIAPGLVDAHCHLEWSLLEGLLPPAPFAQWLARLLAMRAHIGPEDHVTAARLGALRALEAGTTTLWDSGPEGAGAAALDAAGLRGRVHLEAFGRQTGEEARTAADAFASRLAALDAAAGPRGGVGVSPHAPYTVGPDLWRALLERLGGGGRTWTTHLAESEAEERVIARGDGPLGDMFAAAGLEPGRWPGPEGAGVVARADAAGVLRPGLVAAHCVRLDPGDPQALARAGVAVAHCPRSNVHLECGRAPVAELRAAGVTVALGTDSPASGGDYDLRAEARACRALQAGAWDPGDAELLRMITADAARAVGMEDAVGSLGPGRRADLVAVTPPPGAGAAEARFLDARAAVHTVVVDGEILLAGGVPVTLDGDRTRARAAEVRERLC